MIERRGVDSESPMMLPSRKFGPITMNSIVRYQGASGDFNPMHHDDELARSAGYPSAFCVGMLGAGYLACYCTEIFGVGTVRRFRTRFRKLVFRGEVLTAVGEVVEIRVDDGRRVLVVEARLTDRRSDVVVEVAAEFDGGLF